MTKAGNREQGSGIRLLRVGVLAATVVAASFMVMGAQGCGSELHKASMAAASIGTSLATAANVNHDLIRAGVESPEQGAAVATYILRVAKANDVFVADLQAAQKSGGELTSAEALRDFQALVDSANALQQDGVLGIKNQAAAAKFNSTITEIRMQVDIIQELLGAQSSRLPGRNRWPSAPAGGMVLAVALTPEEIEELIAMALATGSSLLKKLQSLRGETDPELLASALADDQAAEAQAIADGAKTD